MLSKAVVTIVECAFICGDYSRGGNRIWSDATAAAQLAKTKQLLGKYYGESKDVFLSHSGKQKNFVRQLHVDLAREHVSCFFDEDNDCLPLGQKFPPLIFKAAETCKIAVVVLSKEFICSKWPMQELSAFVKAMKSGKNAKLILLPIFFKIRPKEFSPRELFHITKDSPLWQELEESVRGEWQDSLNAVRRINGLYFGEDENEVTLRVKVVKRICRLLTGINPLELLDFEPVGIENQVREVEELLDMKGTESALAVIVYGFGGVGKSTLAASVVQSLDWSSTDFKFCRVAIDEKTPDKRSHIVKLQKDILHDLGGGEAYLRDPVDGQLQIKKALENKCCLLFVDNVVDKAYIRDLLPQNLVPADQKTKLRIIITSRENNLKAELQITWKEYEVKGLSDTAPKQLLVDKIVPNQAVENIYLFEEEERMINKVAAACRGVPLLLSVFGKHLSVKRNKDSYQEALDVLREGNLDIYKDEDLGKRLMFVYNKISNVEVKESFLDICMYFQGWEWNLVMDIVDFSNIEDLLTRALVSKSSSGEVIVHDILRFMGMKEAKLTRFSNYKELSDALEDNLVGFENVKGISLWKDDSPLITIKSTQLEAMHQSLRVLMLGDWVTLDGPPCHTAFTNLRYLSVGDISVFPFEDPRKLKKVRVLVNGSESGINLSHLPSSLKRISHQVPRDVECDKFVELPFQNLKSLKSFIVETQKSVELPEELHLPASLVHLDLNRCKNLPKDMGHLIALEYLILYNSDLESLPLGFGKLKNLKHLSMDYCSRLAFLSEELGMLCSLEVLSMKYCKNLRALPESLGGLLSLQKLEFSGCENLRALPESLGGLLSLQTLEFIGCENLRALPESLGRLLSLQTLEFSGCKNLRALPESLGRLLSLQTFMFSGCHNLQELPESLGELRIQSLNLDELVSLNELPNGFGNMPLLKYLIVSDCYSLKSLPKSFVQLKMLETLKIIKCIELSVLPQDFGRLECLKEMTVDHCDLLQELPHGFGAIPALKTFSLKWCKSFANLPTDFTELTSLKRLYLMRLPLMSRIPDGFENMENLEVLSVKGCSELDGAMMEKIVKLPNCYRADIEGSRKLQEKWEQMQGKAEHGIVVSTCGDHDEEERRATWVALLNGKCVEVEKGSGQLMERSSLLEKGTPATLALIMLPLQMQSQDEETLQRFVEKAEEKAKTNESGELQIVCAREVDLYAERPTEEEERAEEEGIHEILQWLPEGSCAIPSSECKRLKILTQCCTWYECCSYWYSSPALFMGNVGVDMELTTWDHVPDSDSESESVFFPATIRFSQRFEEEENKTRVLVEELKDKGIHYLLTHHNTSQVMVDDLHGKVIGLINCDLKFLECLKLKLQQIYKDLQHKDSNFIWIWNPPRKPRVRGHGSYTRLIEWMPWATFPLPWQVDFGNGDYCITLLDKYGQITNHDALPLLMGWSIEAYPFTQHTIPESFSLVASVSCLEFLLHGMNIVGRKPMERKMTFLCAEHPRGELAMKCELELEELSQIHGCFEVLYVGKYDVKDVDDIENIKHSYEAATQNMRWPSLSFWDMITFWYRCMFLEKESNLETLHALAKYLMDDDFSRWLVLMDNGGVVTRVGEDVVQMICKSWDGEGMRMVKDEVMKSLSRGECSPIVRTFFRDEIHNHPRHPQHSISLLRPKWRKVVECGVCGVDFSDEKESSCQEELEEPGESESESEESCEKALMVMCNECNWFLCESCWIAYAQQEVEQLLAAR